MVSIDVIILSWDRVDDTLAAIISAQAQKNVQLHIVVVDQGTKAHDLQKIEAHCALDNRITLICNNQNNGVPGGRNQASAAWHGKYIVALDNDAVFADDYQLQRVAEIMEADNQLGALAFRIRLYGADADDASSWPYPENMAQWADRPFLTTRFVGAGHALRRSAFQYVKGYDARLFFLHEEVDLARRLINAGCTIRYEPSIQVLHKVSPEHRVAWSDKRFYYDIRNKTYLHLKHRTFLPTFIFHTVLMVVKGIRSGYWKATLRGLWTGLCWLDIAVDLWHEDPFVKQNAAAKAYFEQCSPTRGWSIWKRIKMRIADAVKKVGTNP
jgi:GT2 family glycosyltransferase